jgi:hypothetical protein
MTTGVCVEEEDDALVVGAFTAILFCALAALFGVTEADDVGADGVAVEPAGVVADPIVPAVATVTVCWLLLAAPEAGVDVGVVAAGKLAAGTAVVAAFVVTLDAGVADC